MKHESFFLACGVVAVVVAVALGVWEAKRVQDKAQQVVQPVNTVTMAPFGFRVATDPDTGCQYIMWQVLTPRLNAKGQPMCRGTP